MDRRHYNFIEGSGVVAELKRGFRTEASAPVGPIAARQQLNGSSQSEAEVRSSSRTPTRWIRGIHGIDVIRGIEIAAHPSLNLILRHLRMAQVLLPLMSRDGTTSLQQEGER